MNDGFWTPERCDALLRKDFASFLQYAFGILNPHTALQWNWHLDLIAHYLQLCAEGKIKRLVITVPPRYGKSTAASVAFVGWLLGNCPAKQLICASYSQELANKHASDSRRLMQSPQYRRLFGQVLSSRRPRVQGLLTTKGGHRLGLSTGSSLTGQGGDGIIIDDSLKPDEAVSDHLRERANAWYDSTLYTRLNSKAQGFIVLIMQRLHELDLVGHVLKQEEWTVVNLPAIAEKDERFEVQTPFGLKVFERRLGEALHPERESLKTLEQIRNNIGDYNFAGQYQQRPAPAGGGMVRGEWFPRYRKEDLPEHFDYKVQSWDTANKVSELAAYSVCTTWGIYDGKYYLLDVYRAKLTYPELKQAVREQYKRWKPDQILIEEQASGIQLIQELRADGAPGITPCKPLQDKVMRLYAQTARMMEGKVLLPDKADWLEAYLDEMMRFPNGAYSDQVDSTSQAMEWLASGKNGRGWIEYMRRQLREEGIPLPEIRKFGAAKGW